MIAGCEKTEDNDTAEDSTDVLQEDHLRADLKSLGPQGFLQKYLLDDAYTPRELLSVFGIRLPSELDSFDPSEVLPILQVYLAREYRKRTKLPNFSTIEDVANTLKSATKVLIITGAGISTSLGIPDFRSADGIYARLESYNLSDPQEMFDIQVFKSDPSIFYDFSKELLPVDRGYSPTHAFIRLLQDKGILLRQYTQNIDDIESSAGIEEDRLIQCHGSFRTASCMSCHDRVKGSTIFAAIQEGKIPRCVHCHAIKAPARPDVSDDDEDDDDAVFGVMKPDITFFGEQLETRFKTQVLLDRETADLVICIGTSLRVAPVSEMPNLMPAAVPQVFISREGAGREYVFDVELLGQCDDVVRELVHHVGWQEEFDTLVDMGKRK